VRGGEGGYHRGTPPYDGASAVCIVIGTVTSRKL